MGQKFIDGGAPFAGVLPEGLNGFVRQELRSPEDVEAETPYCERTGFAFLDHGAGTMVKSTRSFGDITLSFGGTTGHRLSMHDSRHLTVATLLEGHLVFESGPESHLVRPRQTLIAKPGLYPGKNVLPRQSAWLTATVPFKSASSEGPAVHSSRAAIDYQGRIAGDLRAMFTALPAAERAGCLDEAVALWTSHLNEQITRRLLPTPDSAHSQRTGGRRIVRMAEELMRARFGDPLTISEIAAAGDITPRALQRAFLRERGITPWASLASFRMQAARARLTDPALNDSVTRIALECGISHMGRFSISYHQLFGERPSDTLARSQISTRQGGGPAAGGRTASRPMS